jgi:hypothetical protein
MKLKTLRVWARQKNQELNQDQEVDVHEFTVAICRKLQRKLAWTKSSEKSEPTKSTFSGTLATFTGRAQDWQGANRQLLSYLGQQRGVTNIPLLYVVRVDEERPTILDEIQEEIWTTPLQGSLFDVDNYQVYQILKQWTANGVADTHVD